MKRYLLALLILIACPAHADDDIWTGGYRHTNADILEFEGIPTVDAPSDSISGQARIYFNSTDGALKCSEDGGSYADCVGGGSSQWTDAGSYLEPNTDGDGIQLSDTGTTVSFSITPDGGRDQLIFGVDDAVGNQLVITNQANIGKDHDQSTKTDPAFFIFSDTDPDSDNTEYVRFHHNKSNAIYTTGKGIHYFSQDITTQADDYGADWNGVDEVPTKNDVYDKIDTIDKSGAQIIVLDNSTAVTTGDTAGSIYFTGMDFLDGWNLIDAQASVYTASTSGELRFQVRNSTDNVNMLTTPIYIDANEKDSTTAATASTVDTNADDISEGDQIVVDVDLAGTGAAGLNVRMTFKKP